MSFLKFPQPDAAGSQNATVPVAEDPLTARARAIWSSTDFHPIALAFSEGAEDFVARLAISSGESVLDVACGTGNLALPAARAGASVTGVDIAPNLIAEAREFAADEGLDIRFDVGDAEALPYADHQFHTTVTMFGSMFAFRPQRAAAELVRVTRRGGRVSMANWTPTGFVGKMLRAHAAIVPPPAGVPSPLLWGDPSVVLERFAGVAGTVTCTPRTLQFNFPVEPKQVVSLFREYYGPTVMTLRAANEQGREQLMNDLTTLWEDHNVAVGGGTIVTAEYLAVDIQLDAF